MGFISLGLTRGQLVTSPHVSAIGLLLHFLKKLRQPVNQPPTPTDDVQPALVLMFLQNSIQAFFDLQF
jgi:hypothetical protein